MAQHPKRLNKSLGLFDIYAISTGAMFSSGFFLLPGLAAAQAGPSVIIAYLIAGVFIVPAMVSMAELSTAMPRAGGTYYFLDRSLGPMVGTVGGLGTFLALALKSAFALVGMGAYLAIFIEIPIKPLAIALTVAFMGVNIVGAKETTTLQSILVVTLLSVLAFFSVQGIVEVGSIGMANIIDAQLTPFMPFGIEGLFATVGFVFVSYAGLTKVASVAEEAQNPERDIPLGMILSLVTATLLYVLGVFIMVSVLEPSELHADLTPVATAGEAFFDWLPSPVGLVLIVAAAIAAFASTGNAGLMSASRYPLAMARDRLISPRFAKLGRFRTPVRSIVLTGGLMILCIVALNVEGIAKLASAFQLLIFLFVNLAVIVMRESGLQEYDPGFKSPFYPWMQIFGMIIPVFLIALMGLMPILFTTGIVILCLIWYRVYASNRVHRDGAVYHWFERLGRKRYTGLEPELRGIIRERGLREEDPFDEVVARADILDVKGLSFEELVLKAAERLNPRVPLATEKIAEQFLQGTWTGATPVTGGVALPHIQVKQLDRPQLVLIRAKEGVYIESADATHYSDEPPTARGEEPPQPEPKCAYALFFLASPSDKPGQHLRILAMIAEHVDRNSFMTQWLSARNEVELKQLLLRDDRFLSIQLERDQPSSVLIDQRLEDYNWPDECLVALVQRRGQTQIPHGHTVLRAGDRITVIGTPNAIEQLREAFSEEPAGAD